MEVTLNPAYDAQILILGGYRVMMSGLADAAMSPAEYFVTSFHVNHRERGTKASKAEYSQMTILPP